MKPIKPKQCAVCSTQFKPYRTTERVCSVSCSIAYVRIKAAHKASRELNKRKKELKDNDRSVQLKLVQTAFNEYIRLRDKDQPCISCQRHHKGQMHAGHYITVGSRFNLRFDENNCHAQCAPCNNHLSGNLINYRINLINRIGLEEVERLESDHEPKKYTIEQLHSMKDHYRALCRELKRVAA